MNPRSESCSTRRLGPAMVAAVAMLLSVVVGSAGPGWAADPPPAGAAPRSASGPPRPPEGFPDLVGGLKATPGVRGVETARTGSGKNVIFAWFKDKAAAVRWYNSDMHRTVQKRFFPDRPAHQPLALVPDDVGPIMAIASLTFADSAARAVTTLPVSQIAIELYAPLPGGVFLWSRFAPESLQVKGMLDYTPEAKE